MFSTKLLMLINENNSEQILKTSVLVYPCPSEGICSFIRAAGDRDTEKSLTLGLL